MIAFVFFVSLILLAGVEYFSRRDDLRKISVEFAIDSTLTEPDEKVTLRFSVRNESRWPVLYVGLMILLDQEIRVCEEEGWMRRHMPRDGSGARIQYHFYLLPGKTYEDKFRVACGKRGAYPVGHYYVTRGDFLGLNPVTDGATTGLRLVCTAKRCEIPEMDTRGGLLGENPIRRFILEDPCILRGYREYTGEEPMKQISWTQTAKTGELTVRQNDFIIDRNVAVLVNLESAPAAALERSLEILRSVCEELETQRVRYSLYSNGDVFSVKEGLGRQRVLYIERRIGLSRPTHFYGFSRLVDRYVFRPRENSSCIVITPCLSDDVKASLPRLARCVGREPLLLCGGDESL